MAQLIDGKALAAKLKGQLKEETARLKQERGIVPGLALVRVGEDPASKTYVTSKHKDAEEVGFAVWEHALEAGVSQEALIARVQALNADPAVHGLLVQLPLPAHLDADAVLAAVRPEKDADGLHVMNVGRLATGGPGPRPCTPAGVMRMLEEAGVSVAGKRAVVVGRSNLVGRPMALMLLQADATVTICHRKSDLPREVREADVLVVAAGVPELIKGEWVKPGAVVIDVGINRLPTGKLVGDVEFGPASERASFISPVPGGVGPMTRVMLLQNVLDAARRAAR